MTEKEKLIDQLMDTGYTEKEATTLFNLYESRSDMKGLLTHIVMLSCMTI